MTDEQKAFEAGKAMRDRVTLALKGARLSPKGVRWYGQRVVTVETFDPALASRVSLALVAAGIEIADQDPSRTAVYVEAAS